MAVIKFLKAAKLESNPIRRAKSYYNIGVMCEGNQKYAPAINYYEECLRNNPSDNQARYNLVLCKKLLKNNPKQNKNNKDNKNKNKKNNKDKNKNNKDNKNYDELNKIRRLAQETLPVIKIIISEEDYSSFEKLGYIYFLKEANYLYYYKNERK